MALPDLVFLFGRRDIPPTGCLEPPSPSAAISVACTPKRLCILTAAAAATKSPLSCPTLCDAIDSSPPGRLRHPWDSPGKNTGVGCHFLLQYFGYTEGNLTVYTKCQRAGSPRTSGGEQGEGPMIHQISHPAGFSLQACRLLHQPPWPLPPNSFPTASTLVPSSSLAG